MTPAAQILAMLAAIERQNQRILAALAQLSGLQATPDFEGIPADEARLIALAGVDRAAAIAESRRRCKESGKKKTPSSRGARA